MLRAPFLPSGLCFANHGCQGVRPRQPAPDESQTGPLTPMVPIGQAGREEGRAPLSSWWPPCCVFQHLDFKVQLGSRRRLVQAAFTQAYSSGSGLLKRMAGRPPRGRGLSARISPSLSERGRPLRYGLPDGTTVRQEVGIAFAVCWVASADLLTPRGWQSPGHTGGNTPEAHPCATAQGSRSHRVEPPSCCRAETITFTPRKGPIAVRAAPATLTTPTPRKGHPPPLPGGRPQASLPGIMPGQRGYSLVVDNQICERSICTVRTVNRGLE
ncbi:hypothetical protein SAMN05661093_03126 [Kibdelosporangium aridum]|uniref:Uncharacterized protein n=1 Tax=Kibdelosporangium aridum TaxID=2030 RepID=A0A1W2DCG9_KIBAR|nr:hypothetical protein SAMN05661093_03126 [Kibdelosporangium aridum]